MNNFFLKMKGICLKSLIAMCKNFLFLLLLLFSETFSQTISFDEFTNLFKKSLNNQSLQTVKETLPEGILITAEDVGDFSGDGKDDFAIAYRLKESRDRTIFVNLYCDSLADYIPVFSDTLEFVDLPIEIAFNISNEVCFITQKLKEKSWKIIGYSFFKNELKLVDLYFTDVQQPNKRLQFGEENYTNYSELLSFIGFFDLNSIEQFKKNNYFIFPVYDLKRNIYTGYKKKISINDTWKWEKDSNMINNYGNISFSRDKEKIIVDLVLNKSFIQKIDPFKENIIDFYFDRSNERYSDKIPINFGKKAPKFRNSIDDNISHFSIIFKMNVPNTSRMEYQLGNEYNFSYKNKIKYDVISDSSYKIKLSIPINIFNKKNPDREINNFVSLTLFSKEGGVLKLKSSDGSETDPSSYSKMVIINKDDYFGNIVNNKFHLLQQKNFLNGIIKNQE
jgi:hypothetical protein